MNRFLPLLLALVVGLAACSDSADDSSLVVDDNNGNNGVQTETVCDDGFDNDGDRAPDCADTDCAGDPACAVEAEDCGNDIDDDADGAVDCDDSECAGDPACAPTEDCENGEDDDGDGDVDCDDADCASANACKAESRCDDGEDDDQDGDIDCADSDCDGDPACGGVEDCGDGVDNDGDGAVDCADSDCADDPACAPPAENCADGVDNDDDGAVDCDDSDCAGDPACEAPSEICDDGIDNDDDGAVDCDDANCDGDPACAPPAEICDDGIDNDDDRFIDCADPDCEDDRACEPTGEICDDGLDNDQDGNTDCADSDCVEDPACRGRREICADQIDNDDDGLVDCADPDCDDDPFCNPQEICDDGRDNDNDGRADCDDPDCAAHPNCNTETLCDDGEDNDGDELADCDDPDCAESPACVQGDACADPIEVNGEGSLLGTTEGRLNNHAGACQDFGDAPEVAFVLTVEADTTICLDTVGSAFDTVLYTRSECANPDSEVACNDDGQDLGVQSQLQFEATAGEPYYIFVDGFGDNAGDFVLNVTHRPCGEVVEDEICDDAEDNDGDELVDCADPDCEGLDICADEPGTCALPLEGGIGEFSGTTQGLPHEQSGSCRDSVAPEAIYALQFDVDTTVCADTFGSTFDTVLYAQTECGVTQTELVCNDDAGDDLQSQIEFVAAAGVPVFLVIDGFGNDAGTYSLSVTEGPCAQEVEVSCDDEIDNDDDLLTDCDDPDCLDDPACQVEPELCGDFIDNDGDDLVDCADPDCEFDPACEGGAELCGDFIDNDDDLLVDCDDPDCALDPLCENNDPELCDDFIDNDGDDLVDCDDPDCEADPACEIQLPEICDDAEDNDGDDLVDCDDPDCDGDAFCVDAGGTCEDPYIIDRIDTFTGSNSNLADNLEAECQPFTGNEAVYVVSFNDDFTVCLDTFGSNYDTVLYVRETCDDANTDEACNDDADGGLQSQVEFDALAGAVYYVVVDAFGGGEGDYALNLRLGACDLEPVAEVCDDQEDNDLDGLTDCDDPDCVENQTCLDREFTCDNAPFLAEGVNAGTTVGLDDIHSGTCQPNDGPEAVWRLGVNVDATVCVDTRGSAFDTVLYVREAACGDGVERGCDDDIDFPDVPQSELELELTANTTYFVFVDGFGGDSGDYALNVAFGPCGVQVAEVCDDQVDNDDDGLTDCDDPDCAGDPACVEPAGVCADPIPILQLGGIAGSNVDAEANLTPSCEADSGKEVVYAVQFNDDFTVCVDTFGSGYDTILYVRDDCENGDADLACNDDAQQLQSEVEFQAVAGQTYFVIVDAFGDAEGDHMVNMRLGSCDVVPVDEVCDDGEDNDADGLTDCDDSDCEADAFCVEAEFTCDNAPFVVEGANGGSTVELEDLQTPSCQQFDGPEAVWRVAVNQDTTLCLDTIGSSFDTVLYVREDDCSAEEAELACNDDINFPDLTQSALELNLVVGTTYYVFVDGYDGDAGDYVLNANVGPCP